MNSSSASSSWSKTPDPSAACSAGKRSGSVSGADLPAPRRHDRPGGGGEVGGQRRLVADVAADQQDHRELLALGQAGAAERAQAVLQPGDLVGHHGRAADRHLQDPGVPPQRVVVGPRPAGHAGAPALALRRAAPAARRRPRRSSARAARPWPRRSGRATSRTSRAPSATRLIETAAIPSDAATLTAALTIRSRSRPGFGPLRGRRRTPHASSMLAGRPVSVSSSIGSPCSLTAYALRCTAYGTRRRRSRHDGTGDRGDRHRQVLRRDAGARGRRPAGRAGHRLLAARPQRRGQDHDGADPRDAPARGRRAGPRRGLRRRRRPARGPARDQPHGPVRGRRRAPDRRGEPAHDGAARRPRPRRRSHAGRRSC